MTVRHAVRSALGLLSRRDRRLLALATTIQMATALLDLAGVLLIGLVGALAVATVQSQPPPPLVSQVAGLIGLEDATNQELVVAFSMAAAAVLLAKSLISALLTRRVLVFLANRQALVSARLSKELLQRPLTFIQQRSSQQTAYALISGAGAATSQILGQVVIAATELALLVILGGALLFISPWIAIGAIMFFGLMALALQRAMGGWAARVGAGGAQADIASLNAVQEALGAYREITVASRRSLYVQRIQALRWEAARYAADIQLIGLLPKYLFEVALVVGGFVLAAVLFSTQDSIQAVGTLALFLAAASRVMPSLLRLQGAALGLRSAAGAATTTFELADDLAGPTSDPGEPPDMQFIRDRIRMGNPEFVPSVDLRDVTLMYPGAIQPALQGVSLAVTAGESAALVGRSGSGKTTLVDVILGVLEPQEGHVSLGGLPPIDALSKFPGGISYVPQDVILANDTVRANVALGLPNQAIDDDLVQEALARTHLADALRLQGVGLDTYIGESGFRLSGGQRQRLGIARALYTRPRLLVLDEATSALDAETEDAITGTLGELHGDVTLIIVAHRLSTVRNVDQVAYLEHGSVSALGTFSEVRSAVPAFERQATLMGLE